MQRCIMGERDLKEALAEALPGLGYQGSIEGFVAYWFEKDSHVNRELLAVVRRLTRTAIPWR